MMLRVLFVTFLFAVLVPAQDPAPDPEEERIAQKFIQGVCSTCHDAELIEDTRATKQEWLDIVKNMNGKGAGLSEPDVELLASYLARKFPPSQ